MRIALRRLETGTSGITPWRDLCPMTMMENLLRCQVDLIVGTGGIRCSLVRAGNGRVKVPVGVLAAQSGRYVLIVGTLST